LSRLSWEGREGDNELMVKLRGGRRWWWGLNVVHTGPKANTNKTQHKQIYVVPQNRIRPRRQQIVYYWRNDTNTQLNQVQSHKTQCFTLTLGVSLKSALFSLSQLHYFLLLHTCTHTFTCTNCLHL